MFSVLLRRSIRLINIFYLIAHKRYSGLSFIRYGYNSDQNVGQSNRYTCTCSCNHIGITWKKVLIGQFGVYLTYKLCMVQIKSSTFRVTDRDFSKWTSLSVQILIGGGSEKCSQHLTAMYTDTLFHCLYM